MVIKNLNPNNQRAEIDILLLEKDIIAKWRQMKKVGIKSGTFRWILGVMEATKESSENNGHPFPRYDYWRDFKEYGLRVALLAFIARQVVRIK